MEHEENFIKQWNETFEVYPPMVNGGYIEKYKLFTTEIDHYQIIKQYPFHIKFCDFWHNDVQKQCFIVRINPESYIYFPDDVKKQQSVISTLLTTNYSASSSAYNLKGYYHLLEENIKNKQGFINLALIYHPYIYCGLSAEQKINSETIKKVMLGLKECKLSFDKIFSVIKSIPFECLKLYLSEKKNCLVFAEVIFEENEFESIMFWNSVKEYLYNDIAFKDMFENGLKEFVYDEIDIQKNHIRNVYIYLNFERLERRFSSKNLLSSKNNKI